MSLDWQYTLSLLNHTDFWIASGLVILLSSMSWGVGVITGLCVALLKQQRSKALSSVASIYIWFFRSLPLLVLLIFVYNAPQLFPSLSGALSSPFVTGFVALVLCETAYLAEIHRGGLIGVPKGQEEAGRALGIRYLGRLRLIVLPQSFRVALPSLINEYINIVKATSLVSIISLNEILLVGQRLYTQNFKVIETLIAVSFYYVLIVSGFSALMAIIEKQLSGEKANKSIPIAEALNEIVAVPTASNSRTRSDKPCVELHDLHKTFGDKVVLDGIDVRVNVGEVVSVIGPSGSGKTTMIRTINGLQDIDGGRIDFEGAKWIGVDDGRYARSADFDQKISRIGMVFQNFNLFPHMSAMQNVMMAPLYHRVAERPEVERRAMEVLKKVGMEAHAGKYPHQLSGGQQQRVAIARALVMSPHLMLFDEPTSALDPELVNEVLRVIEVLASEGMTMVIVTHEMRFALKISDRIIFMENGKVAASGTPDELLRLPVTSRASRFLAQTAHDASAQAPSEIQSSEHPV